MFVRMGQRKKGFSTSYLGTARGRGAAIIGAARGLGLNRIELAANLSCEPPETLGRLFRKEGVEVANLQNVVSTQGADDRFLCGDMLVDPRPAEAERAFGLTRETARAARKLGASRIVLRLGRYPGEDLRKISEQAAELFAKDGLSEGVRELLATARGLILSQREGLVDRAVRVLHSLLKVDQDMSFCIETRRNLFEFPDIESAGYIFEDLKNPRLKYWHDAGAAHAQELLGLASHDEWLDRFGPLLEGVRLHDALGLEDRLPPGAGEIDFRKILDALPAESVRILDIDEGCTAAEMRMGLNELEKLGF